MAPCGCFFDPRIYRIEWATANFVQPPVYKISGGAAPQNTYLLEGQKYLKSPVPPGPFPAFQGVGANPPFVLPFLKAEAPAGMEGFGGPLGPGPLFQDAAGFQSEGLAPSEERRLPAAAPESEPREPSIHPPGAYTPLKGLPELGQELAFRAAEELSKESDGTQDSAMAAVRPEDGSGAETAAEGEGPLDPDGAALLEGTEVALGLPEEVLLEVAMKLFDCSPASSDTEEASLDELGGGSPKVGGFPGEESPGDIRSLNLPDELLSFDYSVPEILGAVASLDYLYEVDAFRDEAPWDPRPPSLAPGPEPLQPSTESEEDPKRHRNTVGPPAPAPALTQGGGREGPEPEAAGLAL